MLMMPDAAALRDIRHTLDLRRAIDLFIVYLLIIIAIYYFAAPIHYLQRHIAADIYFAAIDIAYAGRFRC